MTRLFSYIETHVIAREPEHALVAQWLTRHGARPQPSLYRVENTGDIDVPGVPADPGSVNNDGTLDAWRDLQLVLAILDTRTAEWVLPLPNEPALTEARWISYLDGALSIGAAPAIRKLAEQLTLAGYTGLEAPAFQPPDEVPYAHMQLLGGHRTWGILYDQDGRSIQAAESGEFCTGIVHAAQVQLLSRQGTPIGPPIATQYCRNCGWNPSPPTQIARIVEDRGPLQVTAQPDEHPYEAEQIYIDGGGTAAAMRRYALKAAGRLVNISRAAEMAGVSTQTISQSISQNKLRAWPDPINPRQRVVDPEQVCALLGRHPPAGEYSPDMV